MTYPLNQADFVMFDDVFGEDFQRGFGENFQGIARIGNSSPHGKGGKAANRTPNPKLFFQFIFFFKLFSEKILSVGKVSKKGYDLPLFRRTSTTRLYPFHLSPLYHARYRHMSPTAAHDFLLEYIFSPSHPILGRR